MAPEEKKALFLGSHEIRGIKDAGNDRPRDRLPSTEALEPSPRLPYSLVVDPLVGIDGTVRCLALDCHDTAVRQANNQIGPCISKLAFTAEFADRGRIGQHRNFLTRDFTVTDSLEQFLDGVFLLSASGGSAFRLDLTSRDQGGRRRYGEFTLVLGRISFLSHPGEPMRIKNMQDNIAYSARLIGIVGQSLRRKGGLCQYLEIVFGYRRRGKVSERHSPVAVAQEVGYHPGIFFQWADLLQKLTKDRNEGLEEVRIAFKRLLQPFLSERYDRDRSVALQFPASQTRGSFTGFPAWERSASRFLPARILSDRQRRCVPG